MEDDNHQAIFLPFTNFTKLCQACLNNVSSLGKPLKNCKIIETFSLSGGGGQPDPTQFESSEGTWSLGKVVYKESLYAFCPEYSRMLLKVFL